MPVSKSEMLESAISQSESLPPQLSGPVLGSLSLKIASCFLLNGTQPPDSKVKFQWWGNRNSHVVIPITWNHPGDDRVVPLRANKAALTSYMEDSSEICIDLIDSSNKCFGKAIFPSGRFARSGLKHTDPIKIFSPFGYFAPGSQKKVIGHLKLEMIAKYENSVESAVAAPPSKSSPVRPIRVAKKPEKVLINSFQKNEVIDQ